MNRILVLYDSASGNTEKMAHLIAEGAQRISETEVRIKSVDKATADDVVWCEGLAVGSPTNMGILSWKMKRFWDETMADQWMKVDGKIACAFSTAGGFGLVMQAGHCWTVGRCSPILSHWANSGAYGPWN